MARVKDGECKNGSQVSSKHRRSKSASDRNLVAIQRGISHSAGKLQNVAKVNMLIVGFPSKELFKIKQLQMRLQEERGMRIMLERAIGRASSTLSPGHRHFAAQTRELVEEIELLEEEVANREQHVLTLYRNIFEQCASGPPSQQNSVVASPVHMKKNEVRKHPSIISSAFCSSKKFPLEPFQVLSVKRKTSLHSRARRASLLGSKTKVEINSNSSDPLKELVRCMAAIYCWARGAASPKPEKGLSPFVSRILVEHLERVNAAQMEDDAKLAFWINVYNSLVMHAFLAYGIPGNSLRRMALFHKWYETILSTAMRKKSGEEKQLMGSGFGLSRSQPLVCFALCRGATSDPMLKVYRSTDIKEQLEAAKKYYLQTNVLVKKSRKVLLPRLLESFSKEACISSENLLSWVAENIDGKLCEAIKNCIDSKSKRKSSHFMEWLPYDTRFRYTFTRDLTEKPCTVNSQTPRLVPNFPPFRCCVGFIPFENENALELMDFYKGFDSQTCKHFHQDPRSQHDKDIASYGSEMSNGLIFVYGDLQGLASLQMTEIHCKIAVRAVYTYASGKKVGEFLSSYFAVARTLDS
ncbi:hypothetical protein ACLOJK_033303 [Asimina triloba]